MSHRPRHPSSSQRSGPQQPTLHCLIENKHIPIVDAVTKHQQDGAHCFACGRSGHACVNEARRIGLATTMN